MAELRQEASEVIKVNDFNFETLKDIKLVKRKRGEKKKYYDLVTAFDIETTNLDEYQQAIMYIWQFHIENIGTIIGRDWPSFITFIERLKEYLQEAKLIVLVHNLSYEWQWLKSLLPIDKVFAMSDRKVLYFLSDNIEFRCTYLHSNMSLDKYLEKMGATNLKVKGFDYSKKRYPWTVLSEDELLYCINDVRGLVEAYRNEMIKDCDTIISIPYTSTGYVRRLFKKALESINHNIRLMLPDERVLYGLRHAFRGGNTHANRYNANRLLEEVYSYDIVSSYPAVLLTELYPCKFRKTDVSKFRQALRLNKACLFHIYMTDVKLKDNAEPIPYLAKGKLEHSIGAILDNGRILEAQAIDCWINEIDWSIITKQYSFKFTILELYTAVKRRLPKVFRDLLMDMFKKKTLLKGGDEYSYGKYKNMINSVYGMTVQNPIKENYILNANNELVVNESEDISALVDRYLKKGWLPYQWGVWCTSYARLKLQEGIDSIPKEAIVYCDTDSIKFLGKENCEKIEALNERYRYDKYSAKDSKGKIHYIGIYENETPEPYKYFKTLGAKKYCLVDDQGDLKITVAGVLKKEGAKELKDINNFKEGYTFYKAGGNMAIYNDIPTPSSATIEGHKIDIISNIALYPSTYTLGLTADYERLLRVLMSSDIKYSLHLYDEV